MKFVLYFLLLCYSSILYPQANKIHERKKAEIEVFLNKASEHLKNGESETALEYIEDALFVNPLSVEAYYYRAEYYMQIERYNEAIKDLEYVLKYSKDPMPIYVKIGFCYLRIRSLDNALNTYLKAMSIRPDSDIYYYMGLVYETKNDEKRALEQYNMSIGLNANNSKSYYARGVIYAKEGRYDEAIIDFEKAISLGTYDNKYLLNIKCGDAYAKKGNYDLAIEYYEIAIQISPRLSDAYYSRGKLYLDLKYYNDAIMDFSHAISINPYFSEAYKERGNAYMANGEAQKGMRDFDYMKKVKSGSYVY